MIPRVSPLLHIAAAPPTTPVAETIAGAITEVAQHEPMVQDPVAILSVLLAILAGLFWFNERAAGKRIFKVIPMLVFCYFVPTTLTTFGILPDDSELYSWIKTYLLPCSLLLLILALDIPGIIRLGPKAIIMLLAGTFGVVIGGPIALFLFRNQVDPEVWRGLTALSGSWIGGGANMVALGQMAKVTDDMFALMVIVDVAVANIWMGVLLYLAGKQKAIDKWTGANTAAIDDLRSRVESFQEKTARNPSLTDLLLICALGFGGAYIAYILGKQMSVTLPFFGASTWKFILVTTFALILSLTPARKLDGAGASKIGSLFLYLLVASIGAHANFAKMFATDGAQWLLAIGAVWMLIHIAVLLTVGKLIKAPIFFVAVGSQANIGGAASAPIVASAFHPSLAPVGVLLAVAGYVLGTYAGLACMKLMMMVVGAE